MRLDLDLAQGHFLLDALNELISLLVPGDPRTRELLAIRDLVGAAWYRDLVAEKDPE